MENPQLLDLARRPVMTELILEALPDIEAGKPVDCRGFTCTRYGGKLNGILRAIVRLLLWQKSYTFCANFLGKCCLQTK
uniref:Pentapeptide repeat protein n=1 Tax=Nostoc flagelliforme str. Sunitezuoqi TaxID=676037 RepID=E7DPP5_9NOSO|nr:pentapeptide repeat protein [Nostoc flagelliforme str. Sunitezuoqi]